MTPERMEALLRAVLISMDTWIWELERIEKGNPREVTREAGHLLAVIRQAKMSLESVMQQDPPGG